VLAATIADLFARHRAAYRSPEALRFCPSHRLGGDSPGAEENSGHHCTEDESTDMGEERDTTVAGVRGVEQRVVALEELVEKPAAEEEPGRDVDREPPQEGADA